MRRRPIAPRKMIALRRTTATRRMIRSSVETGRHTDVEYYELPEGWDDWSEQERDDYLAQTAVDHQANLVSCGADVVEVTEDFWERWKS